MDLAAYIGRAMNKSFLIAAALLLLGTRVQADYAMTNLQRLSRCAKPVGGVLSWKDGSPYWSTDGCRQRYREIFVVYASVTDDASLRGLYQSGKCRLKALLRFNAQNPSRALKPGEPYTSAMVRGCDETKGVQTLE